MKYHTSLVFTTLILILTGCNDTKPIKKYHVISKSINESLFILDDSTCKFENSAIYKYRGSEESETYFILEHPIETKNGGQHLQVSLFENINDTLYHIKTNHE